MLKRLLIENYRSCLRTSIELNPTLSVLIGPNGSGKTNILQAIMLLTQMARGQEHAVGARRLTTSSRIRAGLSFGRSDAELRASIKTYTNESNVNVILDSIQKWLFTRRSQPPAHFSWTLPLSAAAGHMVFFRDRVYVRQLAHHDLKTRGYFARAYRVPNEKAPKWAQRVFENAAKYCGGIRYYGASQFTNPGACPPSFEIEREGQHRNLHRIGGHARILYAMYSSERAERNERYREFIDIVGPKGLRLIDSLTFREVKSSSTEYSVRVGGKIEKRRRENLLVIPQFRIGRQILSPNQLSEGTFKTLALLFHIITDESTALLVEEPEVCVHHGLLSSILELIKAYSTRKQMILSTHSDYVLDHVAPENVYRVTLTENEGTLARPIRKTMNAKEFAALRRYLEREGNLGEYWREGGLGDRS